MQVAGHLWYNLFMAETWVTATPEQILQDFVDIAMSCLGPEKQTPAVRTQVQELALQGLPIRQIIRKIK